MNLAEIFKKYKVPLIGISILLVIICAVILYILLRKGTGEGNIAGNIAKEVITMDSITPPSSCEIFVDVSGAVEKPNVYCLPANSMVVDAIKKAGGFKKDKYALAFVRSNINLAKVLVNNEKIYIPFNDDVSCSQLEVKLVQSQKSVQGGIDNSSQCASLNTSTKDQLMELSGVGESLAQKIIEKRPFKSVDDLNLVSGVGEQMFNNLKSKVCL